MDDLEDSIRVYRYYSFYTLEQRLRVFIFIQIISVLALLTLSGTGAGGVRSLLRLYGDDEHTFWSIIQSDGLFKMKGKCA